MESEALDTSYMAGFYSVNVTSTSEGSDRLWTLPGLTGINEHIGVIRGGSHVQ